jgi:hypothetical protein
MEQFFYDLAYWFDYSFHGALDHPLLSGIAVAGALIVYQLVGAMKLVISLITVAVAALTALWLGLFLL